MDSTKNHSAWEKIFLFVSFFYFMEVILGGSGSWSKIYIGIDLRRLLFGFLFFMLALNCIKSNSAKFLDYIVLSIGISGFIIWMFLLPVLNNTSNEYAIADGSPLLFIFLAIWLFVSGSRNWSSHEAQILNSVSNYAFNFSVLLSIIHIVIYIVLTALPDFGYLIIFGLKTILDPVDSGSLFIGPMPDGSIRVFWISSLFIIYGLYTSYCRLKNNKNASSLLYFILFFTALIITQTRSLLLAIPLGLMLSSPLGVYIRKNNSSLKLFWFLITLIFSAVTLIMAITASPTILESIGIGREGSDDERFLQIDPLANAWLEHIVFGKGFGTQASYIRSNDAPFSYEMSMLALYMKVGTVGMFIFYSYIIFIFNNLTLPNETTKRNTKEYISFFVCAFIFCFAFNTNPYLSNSVGAAIIILCCFELKRIALSGKAE